MLFPPGWKVRTLVPARESPPPNSGGPGPGLWGITKIHDFLSSWPLPLGAVFPMLLCGTQR